MSTLVTRLSDLATRIATETKSVRTLVNGNSADLSALNTTAKNSIVAAINELVIEIDDVATSAGAQINDAATSSDDEVYSIDKVRDLLTSLKNEILGGAGAAYDTLAEIKSYLDSGDATLLTALGKRVAVDAAQTFTSGEKAQARSNIDAYGSVELGNPDTNLVTVFNAGLV